MKNINYIQKKLHNFIKKYYINEIIKGSILFTSFGLLYFIFTLLIEYFLWLKPIARTALFWIFLLVETAFIFYFILLPVLKLIGFKKGISSIQASKIIGNHFKEVDDKLLNILQLEGNQNQNELLLASIEQKSKNLQPIAFKQAINFKTNFRYLKYLTLPAFFWMVIFISGKTSFFSQSMNRVIHHKTAYSPPAPFLFKIVNKSLQTTEGKSFKLHIITLGTISPENVKISINNEIFYLNRSDNGEFSFVFEYPTQDTEFHFEANEVKSKEYTLQVFATPKIIDFEMKLNFPKYTGQVTKTIKNTGNALIPEGTSITWQVKTQNTKRINFVVLQNNNTVEEVMDKEEQSNNRGNNQFEINKKVLNSFAYQINTSNENVKKYEKLNYQLEVIKDQYPKILVKSDIDSITRGPVQFIGQLSDDYGISKLQVVAKSVNTNIVHKHNIEIDNMDLEEFYYLFPKGFDLKEGTEYEIYFEVFDNDQINGRKKSLSQQFYYNNKTQEQIDNEILQEQKQSIDDIKNTSKKSEDLNKSLDKFSKKLKTKNDLDWNDKKELDAFLKSQKVYEEMLQKNTDNLLDNLEEMNKENTEDLESKKQDLKSRIEETKEMQKNQELLKELEELSQKLKKEDLLDKLDRLKEQSKQETRSLERILELTKRFYVEKKSEQIVNKLNNLSKDQKELSESEKNGSKSQNNLNDQFDSIQKDFNDLEKQNSELKSPMKLEETKADRKLIELEMQKAFNNLKQEENNLNKSGSKSKEAKKNQNSSAEKMKELSKKMQDSFMQMEMESNEENLKDLQQILENLLRFSFDQEELMLSLKDISAKNAEYPDKLKKQIKLQAYFEHIDDSLYTLSLRLLKLNSTIQKDLSDAHYNLKKSLDNIEDNRVADGIVNQQYTMTAANNLADLLSDILENMQNKRPGSGKGKGKKGDEISLPDIIKKQGELIEKMKQGIEKGKKPGELSKEIMSGKQFEIYQEQSRLKEQLNNLIKSGNGKEESKSILHQMDELEKLLLKKGITEESLKNMQKLEHELLKLENASFDQNKDKMRKSKSNKELFNSGSIKKIHSDKLFFKENEVLIRDYLDLQPVYQKKVKKYYQKEEK